MTTAPIPPQVFCIVRASSAEEGLERIHAKLAEQRILLRQSSGALGEVVALVGDTSLPLWGLSDSDLASP